MAASLWAVAAVVLGTLLPQCQVAGQLTSPKAAAQTQFFGADNSRARMTFEGRIEFSPGRVFLRQYEIRGLTSPNAIFDAEFVTPLDNRINRQLEHMFSVFRNHKGFEENPGAPAMGQTIKYISAQWLDPSFTKMLVEYRYEDMVVFHNSQLNGNKQIDISFQLPLDPVTFYDESWASSQAKLDASANGGRRRRRRRRRRTRTAKQLSLHPCADKTYNEKIDFWYFWNPTETKDCFIDPKLMFTVDATVTALTSTTKTFPEYDMLLHSGNGKKTVHVTFIVGIDESFDRKDLGVRNYHQAVKGLKRKLKLRSKKALSPSVNFGKDSDTLSRDFGDFELVVDTYLLDPNSEKFVAKAVSGMEESDVFVYDGHSGLGGHLDIGRLENNIGRDLRLPKDKYQVYFFNGCSTFSYYNAEYSELKESNSDPRGTKMLDIMGTGVGAILATGDKRDVTFFSGLFKSQNSWQKIVLDVTNVDEDYNSALIHINNDADNPSHK
eukprot:m.490944 g.490944  ORF g.490944 m.490944 type:complete len:495 (+) comp28883_c0_seq1:54-1538(+)